MKDKFGRTITIGDSVLVPDPNDSDIHNHSFIGTVDKFKGEYVVVEDGDDNAFDIEPERLEIQND